MYILKHKMAGSGIKCMEQMYDTSTLALRLGWKNRNIRAGKYLIGFGQCIFSSSSYQLEDHDMIEGRAYAYSCVHQSSCALGLKGTL